jgi:predicted flap endonuclease-1-like 5' DNA nuclease
MLDLFFNTHHASNFWHLPKKESASETKDTVVTHTIEIEKEEMPISRTEKDDEEGLEKKNVRDFLSEYEDVQKEDDLKLIEGIGPKTETLLKSHGIKTFSDLAQMEDVDIRAILDAEGDRFALVNTQTWGIQAMLARDGKIAELKEYQDTLFRGME